MIPDVPSDSDLPSWRRWRLWGAPRGLVAYVVVIEIAALAILAACVSTTHLSANDAGRAALLLGLSLAFEEISLKASRLWISLTDRLRADMTSVWILPAAIVVPPTYAIAVLAGLQYYLWRREYKPAGAPMYRKLHLFAMLVLEVSAIHAAAQVMSRGSTTAGTDSMAIVLGLVTLAVANRGLVTGAIVLLGARGRALLGTWDDNTLEIATLCLGGLAAVALVHNMLLVPLVLIPMMLLQRAALVRQLEVAATTDSKTGLLNAITWEQLAQRDLARSGRENTSTAILIIDLDRFKLVNDSYGHLAGDAALKEVGRLLTAELRGYDTVGRFGGEEFVAVLPTTDEVHAVLVAERIRERIAGVRMSALITIADPTEDRNLTVSIGVACSPQDGTEVSELLHAADLALYRAKQTGRNRVEVAGRDTGSDASEKSPVTA